MDHLLTVFRFDEEKNSDVDVAILQALLKGSSRRLVRPFSSVFITFPLRCNWITLVTVWCLMEKAEAWVTNDG